MITMLLVYYVLPHKGMVGLSMWDRLEEHTFLTFLSSFFSPFREQRVRLLKVAHSVHDFE